MSATPALTPSPTALARQPLATGERWTLTGGRVLQLRPLVPEDAAAERAFFNGLSLDSRVQRFHFGLRELSPALLKLLTEVDQRLHRAWVLELPGPEGAVVIADARFVIDSARPATAEFALAVADAWQGRGLGRRLMAHLIAQARSQGLRELVGDVLAENRRMLALLRDQGVSLLGHPDGPQLVRAVLALD
jgi:acetyltransferase